jgi:hypothetical protein
MSNEHRNDEGDQEPEENTNRRGPLVALGVIVFVAVIGWLLFHELSASSRLQDCLLSGRTNCAPIEVPTR